MATTHVIVQGTLKPDGTLELDEKPSLPPGKVRITLEPECQPQSDEGLIELLERIHREQRERGIVPRTREEIDAEINELRQEWEDRLAEIERIREEAKEGRAYPPC